VQQFDHLKAPRDWYHASECKDSTRRAPCLPARWRIVIDGRPVSMLLFDFSSLSVSVNFAIFAGACVVVWLAGTRLAEYADAISGRTKLSKAFLGLVLLGVATSLPEIVTTITVHCLETRGS
jgi:hypothetical protein